MTWYADDVECDMYGAEFAPYIRSIGWLDHSQVFTTGITPESVGHALKELLGKSYLAITNPGVHICNLCQYAGAIGSKSLLIPGHGFLYLCPDLILHYINVHWYKPPEEFCQAVLDCPPPDSVEYKKRLLQNGGRPLIQSHVISLKITPQAAQRHLRTYSVRNPFAFKQIGALLIGQGAHTTDEIMRAFADSIPFVKFSPIKEV